MQGQPGGAARAVAAREAAVAPAAGVQAGQGSSLAAGQAASLVSHILVGLPSH
jgi:hypothetical protein